MELSEMKSKPVFYKYPMRSTTEGRWARFFDNLGYKWEYETDVYGTYKPDFRVKVFNDIDLYVEVKGDKKADLRKVEEFSKTEPLVLLVGRFPHDIGDYITRFVNDKRSNSTYYMKPPEDDPVMVMFFGNGDLRTAKVEEFNEFFGKYTQIRDKINSAFKEASEYVFDNNNCRIPYQAENECNEQAEPSSTDEKVVPFDDVRSRRKMPDVFSRQTYWIRKEYIQKIKDYAATEGINVRQAVDSLLKEVFEKIDEEYKNLGIEWKQYKGRSSSWE